ncbi:MAG: diiron oxygenase [Nocardiaceae bacterium]|nr:diiron oxygenase [Nocardiaceae bacterium]
MTGVMDERFEASEKISSRLIKSSLKQSYDPWTDIDWDQPISKDKPFIPLHRSTLYGTEMWESMSQEQRILLTRHEAGSIASSGIWFEMILMQMILRTIYDMDPRTAHVHWALTEIADECHHSIMFGKALEKTGMPPHRHSKMFNELGRIFKTIAWGPMAYAGILVAEEILDEAQREGMIDESVEPLVRRVNQIHVTEEARHMRFAREEIADMVRAGLDPADKLAQQTICAVVGFAIVESLISPGVYPAVGLDQKEALRQVRNNPNMHQARADWGKGVVEFLAENDLIGGPAAGLWRACHLITDADVERGLLGKGVDLGTSAAMHAAQSVLTQIPGLNRLVSGTLAGIGKGPGKQPKPADFDTHHMGFGNPIRAIADFTPVQAIRKATGFLPWGLLGDPLAPAKRPRKKPQTSKSVHRLAVIDIEPLTEDAVAVTFGVPEEVAELYRYKQGQHITIEALLNDEKVRRNYSICSSVGKQELRIGVKKVPGGVFSSYVVDELEVGDAVDVVPPAGRFFTELSADNFIHYCGIAGGSGITPILSIMTSVLEEEPNSRFTLVYANRDPESIMFFGEITDYQFRYPDRLKVIHVLEQGGDSGPGFAVGRIDAEKLSDLATKGDVGHWFMCGPGPMTEGIQTALADLGVDNHKVHIELFNTIGVKPTEAASAAAEVVGVGSATLTFSFEGAEETIAVEENELLLDAALRTGQDIPWSCREAVCGMCRAKKVSGETTPMIENHSLTDDEVSDGIILTCQSKCASSEVELDFDV